jgi:protein ImuB
VGYAAVYIPDFPAAACMRLRADLQTKAFAVLEGKPPLQKLVSLNLQAKAMRLANGISKVQAEALGLTLFHDRSLRDEEIAFQVARVVMERFSPRIQVIAGPLNNYANEQSL